ncbi:glycosyltransferase family 4 protein [Cellulomonas alba]|uniref:Glycosyltransferase family 4 protein n=1 Tax=Cellulomonas alba TaxID=3053467 RepID=A0ABT7SJ82_9CELL|nr:glycosyltransferase family 4 protein [Cellulomonas alba]MDM7856230.1 glycosyltransferase family 4 protein [Cellulomonas alba]
MNGSTTAAENPAGYDVAYLTMYVGRRDSGIGFTDRFYLDALSRSALSTLVVGNALPPEYPGDGLAYTSSAAQHRTSGVRLHLVNGFGSYVTHQRTGWFPEHSGSHKVAILHEEPEAFDFYATDVWNRAHVRDVLMPAQDDFVFVSRRARDRWSDEAGLAPERTFVLPNTCAEEGRIAAELSGRERRSLRAELGMPADRFELAVVGTVQPLKAQLDVLAAVRQLRARRPDLPVHVSVVGRVRDAPYGAELERAVAAGLVDAVTLVGEVPKATALRHIAAADCLVLASRSESMPLVLLEAMLLGTPVVATRVGGVPEVLDDAQACLVEPADVEALAAGIERAADDSAWATGLADAARARYWAEFSNHRFRGRFDALLHELAARAGISAAPAPVAELDGVRLNVSEQSGRRVLDVAGEPRGDAVAVRATLAAWHAERPLDEVRWRTAGVGLATQLALAAPVARLGLEVTGATPESLVLERAAATPWVTRAEHLAYVGAAAHEAEYGRHVRMSRRRDRARADAELAAARRAAEATPRRGRVSLARLVRRRLARAVRRVRALRPSPVPRAAPAVATPASTHPGGEPASEAAAGR